MRRPAVRAARAACAAAAVVVAVACCGCSSGSSSSSVTPFSLTQLTSTLSAMASLKPVAEDGQGRVVVLLPVTSSDRFFADTAKPDMLQAFQKAGLDSGQYEVELSSGSGQYNQAKEAVDEGARVLILDARYSQEGAGIEAYAKQHHVTVIDYDWLSPGGSAEYYVGFDSLKVGVLQGEGLVSCASAWKVKQPRVLVMQGDPSDYNAALYVQGASAVLGRQSPAGWREVADPHGTWNPSAALSDFQQQYAADRDIGAVLFANDENADPIIQYLKGRGVKPRTLPTVGLDATAAGLRNILAGYQCGTAYKPIYLEVEAAAALALYVRAGQRFPALLNQYVTDQPSDRPVRAVLLTPEWVTAQNMQATVIADGWVQPSDLCAAQYSDSAACAAAGIPG